MCQVLKWRFTRREGSTDCEVTDRHLGAGRTAQSQGKKELTSGRTEGISYEERNNLKVWPRMAPFGENISCSKIKEP